MLQSHLREAAKLAVRKSLQRADLSIGRDPSSRRLARTLQGLSVDHVLDVGANVGQFAALLRSAGFRGRIDSFEPLPDAFDQLSARSAKDDRWHVHPLALGDTPGSTVLHVSGNSYSSSLLTMNRTHLDAAPESKVVGEVEVEVARLGDLHEQLGIQAATTLLKVDTQGFEGPVLQGTGDLLDQIAAVQLELSMVPLYDGQLLFDDLRGVLEQRGLALFALEPGIADRQGRMLQCDGLFVRETLLAP